MGRNSIESPDYSSWTEVLQLKHTCALRRFSTIALCLRASIVSKPNVIGWQDYNATVVEAYLLSLYVEGSTST